MGTLSQNFYKLFLNYYNSKKRPSLDFKNFYLNHHELIQKITFFSSLYKRGYRIVRMTAVESISSSDTEIRKDEEDIVATTLEAEAVTTTESTSS